MDGAIHDDIVEFRVGQVIPSRESVAPSIDQAAVSLTVKTECPRCYGNAEGSASLFEFGPLPDQPVVGFENFKNFGFG